MQSKQDAYVLFTIRNDDNRIARIEFVVEGKSLYEVRRVKTETIDRADIAWNLAGMSDAAAESTPAPSASIVPDMVVRDVAVKQMVEKASFPTYIFQTNPTWAGERQITDILDIVSPPNRMFAITYRAQDGRHVVLIQSASYNRMLEPMTKIAQSRLHFAQRRQSSQQRPGQMVGGDPAAKLASDDQGSAVREPHGLPAANAGWHISRAGRKRSDYRGRAARVSRQFGTGGHSEVTATETVEICRSLPRL